MASQISTIDGPSDGELICAVRAGDTDAYGELFARHVDAARRLARQLVSAGEVDDLVSEAFAKVLVVLQRGGGPDLAFRAYLLTAVRRLHVDRIRSTARLHTTGDLTPFDPGVPFRDTAVEGFESAAAARAFASLPERWQLVLWHTEVEQQKPAEVALLLGMTANSVSALAYRAREGLRQAYLSMHAKDVDEDDCARTRAALGAYVRGGLSRRDSARVEQHLEQCRRCAAIYLELTEVNSRLGALLAPLLLGTAAAAYLGSAATGGAAVATGTVTVLLGRARDAVVAHGPTAAVAGAAASVVAAGLFVTLQQDRPGPSPESAPTVIDVPTSTAASPPAPILRAERVAVNRAGSAAAGTGVTPARAGSVGPSPTDPASSPTGGPTTGTSSGPTGAPTDGPPDPTDGPEPSSPPQSPLVQLGLEASAGPDGVEVGVDVGVLGLPPLEIEQTLPVPGLP